ncbi:tRNA synthetase class II core domain (G, H, P, S and T) [Paenibacillaceae bacterium GAS479]|nr:tRNA synthetase class II core domain (G, H, P, S and T) [Paenibacillaceae bacterium GAS479]
MNVTFDIPAKLLDKIEILLERVPYLSESILGIAYCKDKHVVELLLNDTEMTSEQLNDLRESYQDLCSSLENTRVINERVVKSNLVPDSYKNWEDNENYPEYSCIMDEYDIMLMEYLDKEFTEIATKHGAEQREYPSVLSKHNMTRNQYHIHFPQNIYGVTSVPHEYKAINNFRKKAQIESYDESFVFQGEILQPCICYHCYEELQGKTLFDGKVLTGKGKCFRHEIEWRKDNFRRSEFTMREIVYIGIEESVVDTRNQIMEDVWSLFESLGLKGRISTATDPFFFSQDLKTKGTYQMMSNAKYELLVTTSNGKEVSIASFNYCQNMLCSKYEIKGRDEAALHSGCVAFGIDRWKEALKDLHGRDSKKWPGKDVGRAMLL